ncbi:MAG: methylmalonyl Co-A mutase-associated GTPase MeaB [Thermoplasmata archaeon]|nr:methylmalonyl Co-A mutase-associated GTPase MeaB [Thermoplasmata archaeon]MCI4342153.1 methylmalonyl Co-A mutase-associated GTPase MeaB [Thermoplasmata archaeon]
MTAAPRMPAAARAVRAGDRRALARLISQVENRDRSAEPTLRALYPFAGHATIVGLTGPLGVGKSSLVNALLRHLRAQDHTVGVIGVDPSSPFSGGSVLGDRIRIDRDPADSGIFFRSMASRGHAGGLAASTREVTRLLDAFGMDVVLVETAGSGQVDVEVGRVASTNVVVLVPHLGDEVQSLKAGLFEIADIFCVNKADLPGADGAARYLSELAGLTPRSDAWRPKVVQASAVNGTGIEALWSAVEAHESYLKTSGQDRALLRERIRDEVLDLYRDRLLTEATDRLERSPELDALVTAVEERSLDPRSAAERLYRGRSAGRGG